MSEADIEFTDKEMNSFNELMLIVEQQNGVSFLDLNAFIDFYVKRGMNKIIEIPEFRKFLEKEMEVKERHSAFKIVSS